MGMIKKDTIHAKGFDIRIYTTDYENEFISLTDIAKYRSNAPNDVIKNWMRSRDTLEFLGLWESLHNPDFNLVEFDGVKSQAGLNTFTMSPTKWIETVHAIGIVSKAGRYGGTYAHSDIALEFASWVSQAAFLSLPIWKVILLWPLKITKFCLPLEGKVSAKLTDEV